MKKRELMAMYIMKTIYFVAVNLCELSLINWVYTDD